MPEVLDAEPLEPDCHLPPAAWAGVRRQGPAVLVEPAGRDHRRECSSKGRKLPDLHPGGAILSAAVTLEGRARVLAHPRRLSIVASGWFKYCRGKALAAIVLALVVGCAAAPPTPVGFGTIAFDTEDPGHEAYFNQIRQKIRSNWIYPREAGDKGIEGESRIEFHIAKDGRLAFIALRRSSGTQILDDYAMVAVKLAQPFPPLPDDLAKETLSINGTFRYQIKRN